MCTLTAITVVALCLCTHSAVADELLWARKGMVGGMTTIGIAQGKQLYCTGCNFYNHGRIQIQLGASVADPDVIDLLQPWMSTLWVLLLTWDRGNRCEKEFYTISLSTHNLERVNTSQFGV